MFYFLRCFCIRECLLEDIDESREIERKRARARACETKIKIVERKKRKKVKLKRLVSLSIESFVCLLVKRVLFSKGWLNYMCVSVSVSVSVFVYMLALFNSRKTFNSR